MRFRGGGVDVVAVSDVTREMMPARREQRLVQAEALGFRDAPRREPFAAHMIDMHERFLENRHRDAGPSEHRCQRAPADSCADDHDLGICVFFHCGSVHDGIEVSGFNFVGAFELEKNPVVPGLGETIGHR